MKISLFFIRHIPSGGYLPEPYGRLGRGGSFTEPTCEADKHPRLFRTRASAARALGAWLKGKYYCSRGYDPGSPGNDWAGEHYENIEVVHQPHRIREDMEIVEKEIEL